MQARQKQKILPINFHTYQRFKINSLKIQH